MSIVVWVVQVVLALVFAAAGTRKVSQPKEKLQQAMAWVQDFSTPMVRFIGSVELLAAIGLVLPAATHLAPVLTPLAATGLVVVMIGAALTHARRKESQLIVVNLVLLLLAAFVAWARFGPYAL